MSNVDHQTPEVPAGDLDCQSCGACCVEAGAVVLADEDDIPAPLVQHVANLRCMVTEGTSFRCAALRGTVGTAVGCGIYGRRPEVCRTFDAGSDECLAARGAMARKLARTGSRSPGYESRSVPRKQAEQEEFTGDDAETSSADEEHGVKRSFPRLHLAS